MDVREFFRLGLIDLDETFVAAATIGYLELLKILIEEGVDVKTEHQGGALWGAVKSGHMETVKFLLSCVPSYMLEHCVILAYADFDVDIWKRLIALGANVHRHEDWAFRLAAKEGYTESLQLLLDAGADVHVKEDEALRNAAKEGHTEIVKILLDAGADVHAKGDEALKNAATKGHAKIVQLLLEAGANVNVLSEELLVKLVKANHFDILKFYKYEGKPNIVKFLVKMDKEGV